MHTTKLRRAPKPQQHATPQPPGAVSYSLAAQGLLLTASFPRLHPGTSRVRVTLHTPSQRPTYAQVFAKCNVELARLSVQRFQPRHSTVERLGTERPGGHHSELGVACCVRCWCVSPIAKAFRHNSQHDTATETRQGGAGVRIQASSLAHSKCKAVEKRFLACWRPAPLGWLLGSQPRSIHRRGSLA